MTFAGRSSHCEITCLMPGSAAKHVQAFSLKDACLTALLPTAAAEGDRLYRSYLSSRDLHAMRLRSGSNAVPSATHVRIRLQCFEIAAATMIISGLAQRAPSTHPLQRHCATQRSGKCGQPCVHSYSLEATVNALTRHCACIIMGSGSTLGSTLVSKHGAARSAAAAENAQAPPVKLQKLMLDLMNSPDGV